MFDEDTLQEIGGIVLIDRFNDDANIFFPVSMARMPELIVT
jgi:hypothetical protein